MIYADNYYAKTKLENVRECDEKAGYLNAIEEAILATGFSQCANKMARKRRLLGKAAGNFQTIGDQTRWKLSVWMG